MPHAAAHAEVGAPAGIRRCCGPFDFGPATLGEPLHDFASFGLFSNCGDTRLLRPLQHACGRRPIDDDLPCRLMALPRRHGDQRWTLQRLPLPGAATLEPLARHGSGADRQPAAAA